jgi:hypothetical protein
LRRALQQEEAVKVTIEPPTLRPDKPLAVGDPR